MECKGRACLLRAVTWGCLALAAYCVIYALTVASHLGWALFALPPVIVAMVAHVELQRVRPGAGLLPGRRRRPELIIEETIHH